MIRTVFLLTAVAAAFLLASGVALISTAGLDRSSVADAQTTGARNPETVAGVFNAQWGDPRPGSAAEAKTEYVLTFANTLP